MPDRIGATLMASEQRAGVRDLALCRSLNSELQTFAKWLSKNKSRIPLE